MFEDRSGVIGLRRDDGGQAANSFLTSTSLFSSEPNSSRWRGGKSNMPAITRVRELLDAHVVDVHALVVELAPVGDRVLQRRDARLQIHELLVGLELRVRFGHCVQIGQAAAQLRLRLAQLAHVLRLAAR